MYLIGILLYKSGYNSLNVKSNFSTASKIFIIFSHNLIIFYSFPKKDHSGYVETDKEF